MVVEYNTHARGPAVHQVLGQFLSKSLVDGVVDWGSQVSAHFRHRNTTLQKEYDTAKQQLRALEGKIKAMEEISSRQQDSYEKALQVASERLLDERRLLKEEATYKQNEIDRLANQIDQLTRANTEELNRIDIQLVQARETVKVMGEQFEKERDRRDIDVKGANRELLQSEREFHKEEKNLMQGQNALYEKVVDLQRQIGDQKATQLRECLTLSEEGKERLSSLEKEIQTKEEAIKTQTILDIKNLKVTQDEVIQQLEAELNEKQAYLSSMNEVIKTRRPSDKIKTGSTAKTSTVAGRQASNPKKSEDCCLQ